MATQQPAITSPSLLKLGLDGKTPSQINASSASEASNKASLNVPGATNLMGEISSPHQLTDWVDTLISQLENRFDDMSNQVGARMNEMSNRIDALENSIQDLISGASSGSVSVHHTGSATGAED
ncbi:hypothetical protein IE53DRAFT_366816 [Violaceomyces palustris]|uniref:Uncharacterized protein n=1 Tax=Violaceomyces palustris TaxID=1673888 RepID=A0ACD0P4D7_9BASI|nr:hypothetical protein IE53DRAFT_366816 [Violaceomyces palustris]